ncbi:nitrate- and nitrite sensing domain-containing protein [Streptomyces sp. TRM 70361]|uniref:sensor histidine kinase n=1 Tax=Streptomyces sp. TRM 70361 TaxID=3116553 RepID=UPI002E7BE14E|nr:nitrate- and nitrite sensing domain-containing protein [Streptomyces sp. TRM 70361]MEE1938804.1 nitrate- and nitrite sensing domain-containing protein [Streptomyces sp. TRM 70361]
MGKKRLRRGRQNDESATNSAAPVTHPADTVTVSGRRARVRNRLLVSVTLCAVAVLAAGAPGVATASRDLADSQRLVDRAELGRRAVSLSHALADERTEAVRLAAEDGAAGPDGTDEADGADGAGGEGLPEAERARVDSRIRELRADAPADIRRLLDELPAIRRQALSGEDGAVAVYDSYSELIRALGNVTAATARALPGRAENAAADALPDLGRAVELAAGARGLLVAALDAGNGGNAERELAEAGQLARLREQAALADFDQTAPAATRDTYASTVTGTDVTQAERQLARLTDRPRLSDGDRALNADRVAAALTARVDRMRGVEASLAVSEVKRLERLRDDDLTALELRVALLGVCLLLALGVSVQAARSMTRPLAVLRRGSERVAADPVGQEPVAYKGRDDEFAEVVRAVNRLRATAAALHERAVRAEAAAGQEPRDTQDAPAAGAPEAAATTGAAATARTAGTTGTADTTGPAGTPAAPVADRPAGGAPGASAQLALRTLGLVERQLAIIEGLEHEEKEPDRLAVLFRLDHLATRMRRNNENLLLLTGTEHTTGQVEPVPLLDVLRAAVSEIERYERVELAALPPHAQVSGPAADDISHLVAELLDNATAFSAPDAEVRLSGWMLENGEVMLSVQDEGIGMTAERMAELNALLGECGARGPDAPARKPAAVPGENGALGMGLYVVAHLAARHGIRVQLREQKQGGVAAVVVLPRALLPDRPMPGHAAGGRSGRAGTAGNTAAGQAPALPGSEAEANGNALPPRAARVRPAPTAPDADGGGVTAAPGETAPEPAAGPAEHAPAADPGPDETVRIPRVALPGEPAAPAASTGVATGTARPVDVAEADAAAADPAREAVGRAAGPAAAGEPAEHARAVDEAPAPAPGAAPESGPEDAPDAPAGRVVTDKGLPKRTPRQVAVDTGTRSRRGGLKAEELRRRLGGFQQGAREGHRDVRAQLAEETGQTEHPATGDRPEAVGAAGTADTTDAADTDGTVEEARK